MATNPDVQGVNELVPFLGMLRYIQYNESSRVLQQFQYSGSFDANDWYDVPEVMADSLTDPVSEVTPILDGLDTKKEKTGIETSDPLADVSERTPAQTMEGMEAAAKNAPKRIDRSPPYDVG